MRYSIILALATVASAIDIEWFGEEHCRDGFGLRCQAVNPNDCCGGQREGGWAAVQFANIPNNWDIITYAYGLEDCLSLLNEGRSNGQTFNCHGGKKHYRSANYRFFSKKRGTHLDSRDSSDEECLKPNQLFLADKTTYNIADLADDQVEELWLCRSL
ncbi:hypothetical protein IQ06DRAFT_342880 [Phaeosphaeriaceae sp. SRC1lsM3a]|nr:hypothetical protein IQ06DRAFT_342880 [Stagonospora sp. SRC1lsM3a]